MFILGLGCSIYQLSFSIVSQNVSKSHQSGAGALNNMILMSSALFLQPLIGLILTYTQGTAFDGFESYTTNEYKAALIILPFCMFLSFLFSLFILPSKKIEKENQES